MIRCLTCRRELKDEGAEILQRVQSWRRHEARAWHRGVTGKNGGAKAAPAKALGARDQNSQAVSASWCPKM
jgi:hypothetical protein